MPSEFDLIIRYFSGIDYARHAVSLGIGDDAAMLAVPVGKTLAISVDTLVSGVHFSADDTARHIAYKALAVNLSDMAAMGATPQWFTLAITLPESNQVWLKAFSASLRVLARHYRLSLIGGDTTRGPLSISIQMLGLCAKGRSLSRRGAAPGDIIMVSGNLGDAGAGLQLKQHKLAIENEAEAAYLQQRLQCPTPRVALGESLLGCASAAIDVSDGLLADLGHILCASGVGARLDLENLPLSSALRNNWDQEERVMLACTAGDDYELCFTVPEKNAPQLASMTHALDVKLSAIGVITDGDELCCAWHGQPYPIEQGGYRHF